MLLNRQAGYALIIVKHLAENTQAHSISANDLAEIYGFPHEALAKILQRLARAGLLLSHHGVNGGYMLACDPHQINVLDVIRATQGTRSRIRLSKRHRLESVSGHDQLRVVNQIVEDALSRVTVNDMMSRTADFISRVA